MIKIRLVLQFVILGLACVACEAQSQIPIRNSNLPSQDAQFLSEVQSVCQAAYPRNTDAVALVKGLNEKLGTDHLKSLSYQATLNTPSGPQSVNINEKRQSYRKSDAASETPEHIPSHRLMYSFEGWMNPKRRNVLLSGTTHEASRTYFDAAWKGHQAGSAVVSRILLNEDGVPVKIVRVVAACAQPKLQQRYLRFYSDYETANNLLYPTKLIAEPPGHLIARYTISGMQGAR